MQKSADDFREYIENEVLKVVQKLSHQATIDDERLRLIADKTLDLIQPDMSVEELYKNAVKLDDEFSELAPVVQHIMKVYETMYEKKGITTVSNLIKLGQYDEAQSMVKKILEFKISQ